MTSCHDADCGKTRRAAFWWGKKIVSRGLSQTVFLVTSNNTILKHSADFRLQHTRIPTLQSSSHFPSHFSHFTQSRITFTRYPFDSETDTVRAINETNPQRLTRGFIDPIQPWAAHRQNSAPTPLWLRALSRLPEAPPCVLFLPQYHENDLRRST